MKNLYEPGVALQIEERLAKLNPDSPRQFGKMMPAQMVEHCSRAMELALGDSRPPRMFVGRIVGAFIKPMLLGNDKPMRPGAPTAKSLIVADERDLEVERHRLSVLIDRFVSGGSACCTTHPHTFFGHLTPEQWSILMYKHLDHHLRQFGV
ncbi:MAG TPA: DUF1569 domain-containing protein [Terracidiphilus sp.]|jgi:hypothetical protein